MNTPGFRNALGGLVLATFFTSPAASLAQSEHAFAAKNNYVVSVHELKGQKAFDKGSHLLLKGDTAASVPYLQQAVAEYPEHYKAFYDLGVAQLRLGQTAEAEHAFQKSIDLTSGSFAPPQFGMGAILCQKQDFVHAEQVLQRGLELEPGSALGKFYLGMAQFELNRLVEAERNVRQALVRDAKLPGARILLERIHLRQASVQSSVEASIQAGRP